MRHDMSSPNACARAAAWACLYVPVLSALMGLAACGGAGSSSYASASSSSTAVTSSSSDSSTSAPPPSPSSLTVGPITGFGTVHLNGQIFQTTDTTITVDGKPATQGDLRAGQVVEVRSHHDSGSGEDFADQIDFRGNIVGPVSAIDQTAQTLVALGQTVQVSADTSFDDDIPGSSLAGLHVGDLVEISGLAATDGTLQATRIEGRAVAGTLQVIGVASATDLVAKTLRINSLVVDFSGATLADFPASGPADGEIVEANGTTLTATGALLATRLELRAGQPLQPGAAARVEGLITRFASATDFDVAGRKVTTSSTTVFEHGTIAALALNVRVEVEGTADAQGVISAAKIELRLQGGVRMTGQVDSVDVEGGQLVVLGTTITVDAMTRVEDHGSGRSQELSLSTVHTGDWVEIRGAVAADGSVSATRLDREQKRSEVELIGAVAAVDPAVLHGPVNQGGHDIQNPVQRGSGRRQVLRHGRRAGRRRQGHLGRQHPRRKPGERRRQRRG